MKYRVILILSLVICLAVGAGVPAAAAEAETVPKGLEGDIRFTVSALDMTLVGDQEDIYVGTLPREVITWQSGNPEIVTFENGLLTAVGTGSTTVSASYEGRKAEIPVSCLAADRQALEKLDPQILLSPKRQPPQYGGEHQDSFRDAALIGDSISYVLSGDLQARSDLGDTVFMTRSGVTLDSLLEHYKELRYQGQDGHIEDLIREARVSKVFFMLGQRDLDTMTPKETIRSLDTLLQRILEQSPNLEIYLQSPLPEYDPGLEQLPKNQKLEAYRKALKVYAENNGYHYVEIGAYGENHLGNLAEGYQMDTVHPSSAGCAMWVQALKAYMETQN